MSDTLYTIHVVAWDKFQHGTTRQHPWIKDYLSQLHKREYMDLSFHLRGVLQGIRLEYATSARQLTHTTATLSRQLGHRVTTRDLERLSHAGFITLDASTVLAQSKREKENRETPLPPLPVSPAQPPPNGEAEQVQAVYDYWREKRSKTNRSYDRISTSRRTKIRARLREFTPDELRAAIDGVAKDPWDDRARHDDLTIIFRSREQVEKFIDLAASRNGNGALNPIDAARAWLENAGWKYGDHVIIEEAGRRGLDPDERTLLLDLAAELREESTLSYQEATP